MSNESAYLRRVKFRLIGTFDLNINTLMQKVAAGKPVRKLQEGIGHLEVEELKREAIDEEIGIIKVFDYDNKPQSSFAYHHKTGSWLLFDYIDLVMSGDFYVADLKTDNLFGIPIGLLRRVWKNCGSDERAVREPYVTEYDPSGNLIELPFEWNGMRTSKPPQPIASSSQRELLKHLVKLAQVTGYYKALYKALREDKNVRLEDVFRQHYREQMEETSVSYEEFINYLQEQHPYVAKRYLTKLRSLVQGFARYHNGRDQIPPADDSCLFARWYR